MARALTAGMLSAIATGIVRPVFFYEGEFTGGTLNLFTGYGTYSWDSKTWTGDAGLMSISSIAESSDLQAVNFTVALNGNLSSLTTVALAQVRRGLPGTVWLGLINDSNALIADPFKCFSGRADKPDILPDPNATILSVAYESRLIDAERKRMRRYTSEDQHIDYPADLGFDYVPFLQDQVISWGRSAASVPSTGGGGDNSGSAGSPREMDFGPPP